MSEPPQSGADYRLVVVTDSHEVGGAERFLEYLIGALPPTVAVVVVGPFGATVTAVGSRRPSASVAVVPMTFRAMRRVFSRHEPDIVHVNLTTFTACRPAIFAALALGLPTVLVDHLPTLGLTWKGRLMQRAVTARCAARVGVGERVSRLVEQYGGLPAGSVRTIRNGVPPHGARPPRRDGPPLVGTLSRLDKRKGLDVLLRALPALPDTGVVVGGDGPERAALQRLVCELGLAGRVEFVGWRADPALFLAEIDVLVVPSRAEGMPLVILEGMHAGLPVVATDVGSVAEVVRNGHTGLLVPPDDPDALAAALRLLVTDPSLRLRLGTAAARRAASDFSNTGMAASYDALYRAILAERRSRCRAIRASG